MMGEEQITHLGKEYYQEERHLRLVAWSALRLVGQGFAARALMGGRRPARSRPRGPRASTK